MKSIKELSMDSEKIVSYIENSFIGELLKNEDVTDISYNGMSIYYMDNRKGRKESDIKISNNDVKDFVRQIANLTEKQFSFQSPILDVSAGKYRFNAVHGSIARYTEESVINFSLRIASEKPRITDNSGFLTKELISLINKLINSGISIVIGGVTGTGKTEFQKYLLNKMEKATRVIVIDNVLEISQKTINPSIDLNIWQYDERSSTVGIQTLVKNALRSNPDWLIVAESRGGEMLEVLNSAMTGHPIITTIHAQSVDNMPYRLSRMVMMNDKKSNYEDVYSDVCNNFPIYFYLKRKVDKKHGVSRYIDSIDYLDPKGKHHLIYSHNNGNPVYYRLPTSFLNQLDESEDELFNKTFGGGNK